MSARFITGALSALMAGFIVVVSQVFDPAVLSWVAFGVAIGLAVVFAVALQDRRRGNLQLTLDGCSLVISALLIIFALGASGTAVTWLSFAFALALVGIAFTSLATNEIANRHGLSTLTAGRDPHAAESWSTIDRPKVA
jgi:hypothetical protein